MAPASGKRVVIFGCGYVGTAVARWGANAGFHVTALTRNVATAELLREFGVQAVVADLASDTWHDSMEGAPEFALNCVSSGGGGIEAYRHSYVGGLQSIAAWAGKRGRAGTLVYTGSTSVYPQGGGVRVDETAPAEGVTDRARLLLEAEAWVSAPPGPGERGFVLRLAGIYGPARHALLEQVKAGEVAGTGAHHLNLIHRDDIVTAVAACFSAPATVPGDVFNVADDSPSTKAEIVAWLADRLGVPLPRFTGAPAAGRRATTPDRVISNAKAKAVLGWQPRYATFREGYASLLSP